MAYCTATQVAAECKLGVAFSADTSPTATRVAELIAEVDAEIDATLGVKFAVPIVNATDLVLLQGISTPMVAERVRETISIKTNQGTISQNPSALTAKGARARLKEIVEGKLLFNTSLSDSAEGVKSYAVSNGNTPVFEKGCDQW